MVTDSPDLTGLGLACRLNAHPNVAADTVAHLKTGLFVVSDVSKTGHLILSWVLDALNPQPSSGMELF